MAGPHRVPVINERVIRFRRLVGRRIGENARAALGRNSAALQRCRRLIGGGHPANPFNHQLFGDQITARHNEAVTGFVFGLKSRADLGGRTGLNLKRAIGAGIANMHLMQKTDASGRHILRQERRFSFRLQCLNGRLEVRLKCRIKLGL